jgi:hypothetical protein
MRTKYEEAADRLQMRYGMYLMGGDSMFDEGTPEGVVIKELRVKGPVSTGAGYMVVVKGIAGGRPVVAFHGAETLGEAIAGSISRAKDSSLRWKDDLPYNPA